MNWAGSVLEPTNWLTVSHIGHGDLGDIDGKAQFGDIDLDRDHADAQLAHERVIAAIAALGRIGHAQHEALVAPGQRLQAQRPRGGQPQRLAGQVRRRRVVRGLLLDQPVAVQERGDMRLFGPVGFGLGLSGQWLLAPGHQREIQQPVRVVERRAQHLAAPGTSLKVADTRRMHAICPVSIGRECPKRGRVVR